MLNQKWLWNFPEGPCSPCCSPSDCQSLTSTDAAIGWRANTAERYWSPALCHTDRRVQAPFFLSKSIFFFAAMQRFPLHETVYSHSYLTDFPECDSLNERIIKGAFRAIILAPAMRNRVSANPAGFLVCLLKEAQSLCPNMASLSGTYIVEVMLNHRLRVTLLLHSRKC